ncbi:globin domain-containing protein [Amaricoccus tamworthensis]|uniref:globin domain-containing protein n=1 Tax=Amaricoccus tamworthensis TaxID=57002 RepID=UPI003C7D7D87
MTLTDEQIRLIKDSIPKVREHLKPASTDFYETLFSIDPGLRPMFREDLAGQGMKFFSTLNTIAFLLDDPESLDNELNGLAASHSALGVRREHFEPMGSALMITMGETLGPDFTPELRDAWRAAFAEIRDRMVVLADA